MDNLSTPNIREKNSLENLNDQIDLVSIFMTLFKRLWLIAIVAILCGGICFAGTKLLVTPTYRSSFSAYINNRSQISVGQDSISSGDLTAGEKLVSAYSKTITSKNVLMRSAAGSGLNIEYDDLESMVSTQIESDTGIIKVYVEDVTPDGAYSLAKAIAEYSPDLIPDIIEGSSMKIIDMPEKPTHIYKPNYVKMTLLGVIFGGFLTAAYIVIKFLMDDKVKSETDLETKFSLPVVGVIPDMNVTSKGDHNYYDYEYAYRYSDIKRSNVNDGKKK